MDQASEGKPKKKSKKRGRRGGGAVRRHGKNWQARWVENGERKTQSGFATPDDARTFLESRTKTVIVAAGLKDLGVPLPKVPKNLPSLKTLVLKGVPSDDRSDESNTGWLQSRADRKSYVDDRNRWTRHLEPVVGKLTPDVVTKATVEKLVTQLKTDSGLSPASIERVLYTLSAFYRWAIRRELVAHNPVREYLASLERTERNELRSQHDSHDTPYIKDKADVIRLFQALPEPVNVAYALSALAGLRPGEVVALEWADVDLKGANLKVRRRVRHGKIDSPKSGEGRDVSLVPSLVSVLRTWKAKCDPTVPLVVPSLRRAGDKTTKDRHLGPKTIAEALKVACDKTGLPRLTFYQAGRHTFASLWVKEGLDIYRLSKILGHASVTTTSDHYAHLAKETPEAILARADVALVA